MRIERSLEWKNYILLNLVNFRHYDLWWVWCITFKIQRLICFRRQKFFQQSKVFPAMNIFFALIQIILIKGRHSFIPINSHRKYVKINIYFFIFHESLNSGGIKTMYIFESNHRNRQIIGYVWIRTFQFYFLIIFR